MAMRRIVKHFIGHSGRCWHDQMLPHFGRQLGFFNDGNHQSTIVHERVHALYVAGGVGKISGG